MALPTVNGGVQPEGGRLNRLLFAGADLHINHPQCRRRANWTVVDTRLGSVRRSEADRRLKDRFPWESYARRLPQIAGLPFLGEAPHLSFPEIRQACAVPGSCSAGAVSLTLAGLASNDAFIGDEACLGERWNGGRRWGGGWCDCQEERSFWCRFTSVRRMPPVDASLVTGKFGCVKIALLHGRCPKSEVGCTEDRSVRFRRLGRMSDYITQPFGEIASAMDQGAFESGARSQGDGRLEVSVAVPGRS